MDSLAVELVRKLQRGALEQRDVEVELRELQPSNRERSNMVDQAVLTHVLDQLIRLSVMQRRGNVLKSDVALRFLALNRDEDDVLLPVHDVCVQRAAARLLFVQGRNREPGLTTERVAFREVRDRHNNGLLRRAIDGSYSGEEGRLGGRTFGTQRLLTSHDALDERKRADEKTEETEETHPEPEMYQTERVLKRKARGRRGVERMCHVRLP